jgi:hypothetical protein
VHLARGDALAKLERPEQEAGAAPRAGRFTIRIDYHPLNPERVLPGELRARRPAPVGVRPAVPFSAAVVPPPALGLESKVDDIAQPATVRAAATLCP